jgi:hypothetical protein
MNFVRRLISRFAAAWRRSRPLPEPDMARLKFLGAGYELSNGELDTVPDAACLPRLKAMQDRRSQWVVIVTITRERTEQWWVRLLMATFGPPVSGLWLSDGRRAFCTWAPT